MNTSKEYKDDPIKEFLNPEMIERAPSGFTEALMTRVSLEAGTMKTGVRKTRPNYVPLVSLSVILILTVLALTLPSSANQVPAMKWMKFLHNINLPSLDLNLESLLKFRLPGYIPYLLGSILCLSFFDRALNLLFHRGK